MPIKSIVETSLIDWDGKITMVLFFGGCNFRCPFCHNWRVAFGAEKFSNLSWDTIEHKIKERREWLDGIVLSGGEPLTGWEELVMVCSRIKNLNIKIKLDTNGANPDLLKRAIGDGLIDYVAMDIKAPLDQKYSIAAGVKIDPDQIRKSIQLLMASGIDYEFRTTVVPNLIDLNAVQAIAEIISGARLFALQQFLPKEAYDPGYQLLEPYTKEDAEKLVIVAQRFVRNVKLRGF